MTDIIEKKLRDEAAARKTIELVLGNVGGISFGRTRAEMPKRRKFPGEKIDIIDLVL